MGYVDVFPKTITVQIFLVTEWTLERGAIEGDPV